VLTRSARRVDRAFIALSTPLFIDTRAPVPGKTGTAPWQHLLIAQDTAAASSAPCARTSTGAMTRASELAADGRARPLLAAVAQGRRGSSHCGCSAGWPSMSRTAGSPANTWRCGVRGRDVRHQRPERIGEIRALGLAGPERGRKKILDDAVAAVHAQHDPRLSMS